MIKNYLRILLCGFALSCNALPALANFDITVGSGTHIFSIDSGTTPAGTGNCAASATECTASIPIDKSGTPLFATGNAGLVTGTGGTFPATQSGTWTVQPGNTANTTPWLATINQGGNSATVSAGGALKVDGSAATQPVSGTVTAAQATASSLNATVVGTGTFATQATQSGNWTARVVGNAGGVVDFTGQAATAPANALLAGATFFTTPTTLSNGQASPLQVDNAGNLLVNVKAGGASGGTSSNFGSAFPTPGTAVGMSQGGNMVALTGTSNNLNVQCANCSGSGVSTADEAAFSAGSSLFAGGGGFFQTTATSNALTNGQQGMFQLTANRAIFSNLRNAAGTEVGTAGAPLQVSVANTAANGTAMLVTGTGGTFPVATWGGGTLGAMANYGTSPGAVLVPGVNAFVTNTNGNGSATSANSSPVVIASDQVAVAVKAASGALASGSIASGAVASGAVASGAFASGSIGSGAIASGAIASGAVAAGAYVSGSILSGALASGAVVDITNMSATTGSAPPSKALYIGANSSGATGGQLAGVKSCDSHAKYDASDNGSITLVTGVASRKVYICGFLMATGGTATNLKLREGSDANCATNAADLTPAYQLAANDRVGAASAFWTGLVNSTNAYYVCINASAGNAHQAELWYTVQ